MKKSNSCQSDYHIQESGQELDQENIQMKTPEQLKYKSLQDRYLAIYFLASFSNWLQGPYIYRVYSDQGWSNNSIAYLYVTKYATNCLFGLVVGQLADKHGRKILCTCYAIFFTITCLTKLSSNYFVLLCGKMLCGISTSILYSVFEAWYLSEHLNYYNFPPEWLNDTFSKATVYNGVSAILAGITGQILVEYFNFSPLASSLFAIPILMITFTKVQSLDEHTNKNSSKDKNNNNSTKQILDILILMYNNKMLLLLGTVQCLTETVMYVFIFSWTPILSNVELPLGIVFTSFMVSLMFGSQFYNILISKNNTPQKLLTYSIFLATISFLIISIALKQIQVQEMEPEVVKSMSYICLMCFILYEFSLGIYYPSIGYLRGRLVPEEYRATLVNWFRVPMNLITCCCLCFTEVSNSNIANSSKCQQMISFSSAILAVTVFLSSIFSKGYNKSIIKISK